MTDRVFSHYAKHRWLHITLRHLLPFLWALAILWLSLTSSPPEVPGVLGWDKLLHAGAYGLLALLAAQLFALYHQNRIRTYLLTGLTCALYGALIEVLQMFGDAGRTAEWWDIFADLVGIALACVIFRQVYPLALKLWNTGDK